MAEGDYPIPVIDDMRIHSSQNRYLGATSGREIPPSNTSRQQEMQQGDPPTQSGYNLQKNLNRLRRYQQEDPSQHDASGNIKFKHDHRWIPENSQQESPTPEDFHAQNGFIDAKTGRKNPLRRMTREEIEVMESQDKEDAIRKEEAAIARVKEQNDLREAKEKRRIRDEEEMYQGLKNFKGNQRGWNGEREPERRATIQRYHEQEDLKLKEQAKAKRRRASTSTESKSSKGKTTEDTQSYPNQDEQPEHISKEELAASMMAVWDRRAIEEMAFDDYVEEEVEKTRAFLRSRKWDVDAIKADAIADAKALKEGKVRSKPQSKRGKRRSSGMTRESIPSPPNTQPEQHRENSPVNSDSSPLTGPPDAQRLSSKIRRQSSTTKRRSRGIRPTEAERLAGDGILGVWSSPPISEHRQSQKEESSLLNHQPPTTDDQPPTIQQNDTSSTINHQPNTISHHPSPTKPKSGGPRPRPTEAERLASDGILGVWSSPPTSERRQSKKAPSFTTTTNDSQPPTTDRQLPTPKRRSGGFRPTEAERLAGDGILGMGSSPPVMPRLSQRPKYYGQEDGDDES